MSRRGNRSFEAAPVLILLLALTACSGGGASGTGGEPIAAAVDPLEGGAVDVPVTGPLQRQTVEVYYPAAQDHGLVAEAHEIFVTAAPGDRAKQIVADLISGPTTELALRALPPGTQLRQIYVLDNGVAYLDFSSDLKRGIGGGSTEELFAVYAIVNSVVLNVIEIERVGILVDGQPVETLNGHVDLSRPLPPNIDLIVGRVA